MECCLCNLLLYTGAFLGIIVIYFKWSFQYFKKKNIPTPPTRLALGNMENPLSITKNVCILTQDFYNQFKQTGARHFGLYVFSSPIYVPIDLDIIKGILIKDFNNFVDRGVYYNEKDDPLSAHLFSIEGKKWRSLRNKLSPTFTSGRMKMMFNTLLEVGNNMEKELCKVVNAEEPLDVKEILAKFSTDVIGSCAFGIDCNSFVDPDSEFRKYGKRVFQVGTMDNINGLICTLAPNFARKLGLTFNKPDLTKFFMKVVKDTVRYREDNNISRNDFMNLLIELKNGSSDLGTLTIEEIAAQAFVFFLAGFETSSTTMTFCLFELAQNQEIQEKLRRDINTTLKKHDGKFSYDALTEMKYMSKVIDETLRKYPPIPQLNRICTKACTIPETNVKFDKGQAIFIPVYSIHHDKEYYPNPEKFDPERFTDEAKAERNPFAFLPFGEGPRNCIGLRFGLMQTKVGLATMLRNFKLTLNEKTKPDISFEPLQFTLNSTQTILLNITKVE